VSSAKITFLAGSLKDRKFRFNTTVSVGRAESNTLHVADSSVSSRHCQLVVENDRAFIKDLDSTNGTKVNERPVQTEELRDGDVVSVGAVQFRIQFEQDADGEKFDSPRKREGHEEEKASGFSATGPVMPTSKTTRAADAPRLDAVQANYKGTGTTSWPLEPVAAEAKQDSPRRREVHEEKKVRLVTAGPAIRQAHGMPTPCKQAKPEKSRWLPVAVSATVVLVGVVGAVYFVRHKPVKTGTVADNSKLTQTDQARKPLSWDEVARTFKLEGDPNTQAGQRIEQLRRLIRQFPLETNRILAAYIEIGKKHDGLKQYKDATAAYRQFLEKAPTNDNRRFDAKRSLLASSVLAGEIPTAKKTFDEMCQENVLTAAGGAERVCWQILYEGRLQEASDLVDSMQTSLAAHVNDKNRDKVWNEIVELGRCRRHARNKLWMQNVHENMPWDTKDEGRMLVGILGAMRSLDVFVKALSNNERLVGEGCDVSGRFQDHSYIIASQYPCKADECMQWYKKTGFPEYRDVAAGLINKMAKLRDSSKDVDGRNWLPIGQFVDLRGKAWGYGDAPKLDTWSDVFPYDQSKSRHNTHHIYMDAWGLGMWELAKSAGDLKPEDRKKLVDLLVGVLDFYHRSYVLKSEGDVHYWRTDEFSPLNPTNSIPEPDWAFLGLDVIHAALALHEMKEDTSQWHDSFKKFAAFYMAERPKHNDDKLVEYTDLRAIDLAGYLQEECKDKRLGEWLEKNLVPLYRKRQTDVCVVADGRLLKYSPLPIMEIFARYAPDRYREMWNKLTGEFVTPYGIFQDGEFPDINESEQEGILDISLEGLKRGCLSGNDFKTGVEKMFLMWGNPRCYKTVENWVTESFPYARERRSWQAIPYAGYPENVRPEGYYAGMPQGFTLTYTCGLGKHGRTMASTCFNCLVQYTSPGGHHTERIRFGRMTTFNLMDTTAALKSAITEQGGKKTMVFDCAMPDVPGGTPCAGIVKVTDAYYKDETWQKPTGYTVTQVLSDGKAVPFKVYALFAYEQASNYYTQSEKDNVKVGFLLRATGGNNKQRVTIVFEKNPAGSP
jgi:hypothetical protein